MSPRQDQVAWSCQDEAVPCPLSLLLADIRKCPQPEPDYIHYSYSYTQQSSSLKVTRGDFQQLSRCVAIRAVNEISVTSPKIGILILKVIPLDSLGLSTHLAQFRCLSFNALLSTRRGSKISRNVVDSSISCVCIGARIQQPAVKIKSISSLEIVFSRANQIEFSQQRGCRQSLQSASIFSSVMFYISIFQKWEKMQIAEQEVC